MPHSDPAPRSAPGVQPSNAASTPPDAAANKARPTSRIAAARTVRAPAWRSLDILRATALVIGFILALVLLWVSRQIVLVTFLGVLFGLAVGAATDRLERLRIPRGVGAAAVLFSFVGVLYGVGALIAPTLAEQAGLLRERVPEAVDRIERWVNERPGLARFIIGGRDVASLPAGSSETGRANAPATSGDSATQEQRVEADSAAAAKAIPTLRERVTEQLSGVARYLFPFLSSTITVFAGIFLILVLAIYVGASPTLYHNGLMKLFPRESRERAGEVLTRLANVLRQWLVTQLVAMVAIGTVTTLVLMALDVKSAVALGVIAGFLEFIPTVGPILSAVPAVAMAFLDSPEKALSVAVAYLVIQQLEGNVLIPILMKEGMDLPPALTIVAQAIMALLFGFLGLLVAVPVLAAIVVPIKMLYVEDVLGEEPELEEAASPA